MEFEKYFDKKVKIVLTDKKTFVGVVYDKTYGEDDDSFVDGILIDSSDGALIELKENEIQSIESAD
ncbi:MULTISPECIES: hypothetical protein [unclassified Lactococcus]|uniref:hypothetical protein n=1 Tax=unclassified Lactococcus TaxID=2643510 RepID=UPI0011C8EE9E|nr:MULTISPECIES: hypothetical protein [unclassified Lactococcus]MQW23253.1 hypothetical protein [Lactococcus sp. dk101]TXK38079.1 hypothetical protein FVP42_06615 [Lactococcus sp. dk310]TXK49758.1 hypothetical protein FVP43_06585 [Lactococcus sp. dk322]